MTDRERRGAHGHPSARNHPGKQRRRQGSSARSDETTQTARRWDFTEPEEAAFETRPDPLDFGSDQAAAAETSAAEALPAPAASPAPPRQDTRDTSGDASKRGVNVLGATARLVRRGTLALAKRIAPRDAGQAVISSMRLGLGILAILAVGSVAALAPRAIKNTRFWSETTTIATREASSGALFRELYAAGLIEFDSETFRLSLPSRDLALRARLEDTWLDKEAAEAIDQLYGGTPGLVVQQEVAVWNAAHLVAGLRDDRAGRVGGAILPIGANPSDWRAEALLSVEGIQTRQGVQSRAGLSLDLFGYFGWHDPAWPAPEGDWLSAAPRSASVLSAAQSGEEAPLIRFTLPPKAGASEFMLDLVGADPQIEGASVKAQRRLCAGLAQGVERPNARTGRLEPRVIVSRKPAPVCGEAQVQRDVFGAPAAFRYRLAPKAGAPIHITVTPVPHIPDRMAEFKGAALTTVTPPNWDGWRSYHGGESITLRCREGLDDLRECALDWVPRERPGAPEQPEPISIRTADGVELALENGDPGPGAGELALTPLVGLGTSDRFGLGGALARQPRAQGRSLTLTLRAEYQQILREELMRAIYEAPNRAFLAAEHDAIRRAAVVLIDAGEDPAHRGEILAAADFPSARISEGAAWNILGYDVWRPLNSPLAPRAWARIDAQSTPGSTLKTLTALSLLRAAADQEFGEDDGPLHRAIIGTSDPALSPGLSVPEGVRLDPGGWVEIPGRFWAKGQHDCVAGRAGLYNWRPFAKICNFVYEGRLEKHDHAFLAPVDTRCPVRPGGGPAAKQLGLCEATATSLNSWFIMAGLGVDGVSALPSENAEDAPPRAISSLARRFPSSASRNLMRLPSPPAARFRAERIVLDGDLPSENPLHTLALNTIGQNAQASPLGIATLYASIASRCRVDPRLVSDPERLDDCPPLFFDEVAAQDLGAGQVRNWILKENHAIELMEAYLRPGLNAVVNSRYGTADGAFRDAPYREFIYGKTGTAEVPLDEDTLVNSLWFAGWAEPQALIPDEAPVVEPRPRRLAFACLVSHGRLKRASGGRVCAPIIRKVLDRIRTRNAEQAALSVLDSGAGERPVTRDGLSAGERP